MEAPNLEIGAGLRAERRKGWINADLYPGKNIDIVFDAMKPWPFEDGEIQAIRAVHVLEHLPDPVPFMREAHRVLKPTVGCMKIPNLHLQVPYGPSESGFGDITHLRYYVPNSFHCFGPSYTDISLNPQHHGWDFPFATFAVGMRIHPKLRWLVKPGIRRFGLRIIPWLWGGFFEMAIQMMALKTPEQIAWWENQIENKCIPVCRFMYNDEYYNLPTSQRKEVLYF